METINISTNKAYKMVVDGFACYVHVDRMETYDNQVAIIFEGALSSYYHDSSNEEESIECEDEPSDDKKERGGFYKLMQKCKES